MASARKTKILAPKELPGNLWEPQQKALKKIFEYLDRPDTTTGYLVRMPTGTGKTGLIAFLACCHPGIRNILVVTPWANLRDQLGSAIVGSSGEQPTFWKKIGLRPPFSKKLFELFPSNSAEFVENSTRDGAVLVATTQTLERLFSSTAPSAYQHVKSLVDAVVVDEGHYEPAVHWAQAIRGLEKPTILLTATPYRNDLKLFRVKDDDICEYTHEKAEKARLIRCLKFVNAPDHSSSSDPCRTFVDGLLAYYNGDFRKHCHVSDPRIIVRCAESSEVAEIAGHLARRGLTVVGVHDTFANEEEDYLSKAVPRPQTTDATFWVHQNKLTEGLDDARFALLAVFANFRNQRALVQQIGRILRIRQRKTERGIVYAPGSFDIENSWNNYRTYERTRLGTRRETLSIFDNLVQNQPEVEYFDRLFRPRFDFSLPRAHELLKYKLNANLYRITKRFQWSVFQMNVEDELSKLDRIIRCGAAVDENTYVWIYALHGNCPHLRTHALFEFRLGYSIAALRKEFLFFYDSEKMTWFPYLEKSTTDVGPATMEKLLPSRGATPKAVSLTSSLWGRRHIHGLVIRGHDIQQIPPTLLDHLQICSSVNAFVPRVDERSSSLNGKRLARRYMGVTTGKIRDDSAQDSLEGVTLQKYLYWVERLAETLQGRRQSSRLFARYAKPMAAPTSPIPSNILLDFDSSDDEIRENSTGRTVQFQEVAAAISRDDRGKYSFRATLGEEGYDIGVSFGDSSRKFTLSCPRLSQRFTVSRETEKNLPLVRYLNRFQNYRIALQDGDAIYHAGLFFGVQYDLFEELLKNVTEIKALAECDSEKGYSAKGTPKTWPVRSVFHLLDPLSPNCAFRDYYKGLTHIVCDDLGYRESADFIAADLKDYSRVVLIHAKDGQGKKLSASVFQDVCGQANKNLNYLTLGNRKTPPNAKHWNGNWRLDGLLLPRWRRRPKGDKRIGGDIWQEIQRKIVNDPNSLKEMWLVMGRGLSMPELRAALKPGTQRPPELVHLAHLLSSTWGFLAQVGVKLTVFC